MATKFAIGDKVSKPVAGTITTINLTTGIAAVRDAKNVQHPVALNMLVGRIAAAKHVADAKKRLAQLKKDRASAQKVLIDLERKIETLDSARYTLNSLDEATELLAASAKHFVKERDAIIAATDPATRTLLKKLIPIARQIAPAANRVEQAFEKLEDTIDGARDNLDSLLAEMAALEKELAK